MTALPACAEVSNFENPAIEHTVKLTLCDEAMRGDLMDEKSGDDVFEPESENESVNNSASRPSFDEVYKYAEKAIKYAIRKRATHLPTEIQDEISQEAFLRCWKAYQNLDGKMGWKSFIQIQCTGAVQDFLKKKGGAFIESGGNYESETDGLKTRAEIHGDDGETLSVEDIVGILGHDVEAQVSALSPHWDLLSRMVMIDEDLHIVAKVIVGFTQEEIAEQIERDDRTISRERVSQRIHEFFERLDDYRQIHNAWTNQCIYALGLSDFYHMPAKDNGEGWDCYPFDVSDPMSFKNVRQFYKPSLFDWIANQRH